MSAVQDLAANVVELAPFVPRQTTGSVREMAFRKNTWTPAETDMLRRMFAADAALDEMAQALGRGRHAVRSMICDLGMRRNSTRPWSELEDAEILKRYGSVTAAQLAQELGRSVAAVYGRAQVLRVSEARAAPYDGWEDAQISAGYASGVPVGQIATLIGRPMLGVLDRAMRLGLRHTQKPVDWSEEEVRRALELAEEGQPYTAIIARMAAEGFPARTKLGFGLKVRALGYGRGWGRPWTDDEDELLRRAYQLGESLTPVKQRLGRSSCSIRWRVGHIGLQGTHKNHAGFRQGPDWTPEQDDRLREAYGSIDTKALAAELGRGRMAVCQRANVLGLVHGYHKPFGDDERQAIRIAWSRGLSLTDLSKALERDVAVVSKQAIRLGLPFSSPSRPKAPRTPRASREVLTLQSILAMESTHG